MLGRGLSARAPGARPHRALRATPRSGGAEREAARSPLRGPPSCRRRAAHRSAAKVDPDRPLPTASDARLVAHPSDVRSGPQHAPSLARARLRGEPIPGLDLPRRQRGRLLRLSRLPSGLPHRVPQGRAPRHARGGRRTTTDPHRGPAPQALEGRDRPVGGPSGGPVGEDVELLRGRPNAVRPLRLLSPPREGVCGGREVGPLAHAAVGVTGAAQNAQRFAFTLIVEQHSGHSRVLGGSFAFLAAARSARLASG